MNGIAITLVIGSGMLHAIWNLLAKRSGSQMAFLWWSQAVAAVVFVPLALLVESGEIPKLLEGMPLAYLLISMGLHGVYMVLLAYAYKAGDLSVVYPIMRGTSPVMVPVLAVLFLRDPLKPMHLAGIALIVMGILMLGRRNSASGTGAGRTVALAIGVGLTITAYTFADKLALTYGGIPPLTLNAASNVGNALCLAWFAFKEDQLRREWRMSKPYWIMGGLFASGGYTLFLYALTMGSVAQLAPMREIGTVFAAVLGYAVLKETQGPSRIVASVLITAGVVAIGW